MRGRKIIFQNYHMRNNNFTTRNAFNFFINLGHIFGMFPIQNSDGTKKFKFSFLTLYCVINPICCFLIGLLYLLENFRVELSFWEYGLSVIFYFITSAIMTCFIQLAFKWPCLMKKWQSVDLLMASCGVAPLLEKRLKIMICVLYITALAETVLSKVTHVYVAIDCGCKGAREIFEYLMTKLLFKPFFIYVDYSPWKGILLMIFNTTATFAWTYGDGFVVIVGTALALRFRQISQKLQTLVNNNISDVNNWKQIRENYQKLAKLTKSVDNTIGNIICLCFANNLIFIIVQLFNSLRYRKEFVDKFYFFFSFAFLIIKTNCTCLYTAWVNDESKKPSFLITKLPSECFNPEISRFLDQLYCDNICLTGKKMFNIKRGLILSMASAIVTYELIFLQLNYRTLEDEWYNSSNLTC